MQVYTVAADSLRGPRLVEVNVSSGEATPLGRWSAEGEGGSNPGHPIVDPHYVSVARQIQFPTTQGDFAYGYLYMPKVRARSCSLSVLLLSSVLSSLLLLE